MFISLVSPFLDTQSKMTTYTIANLKNALNNPQQKNN